MIYSRTEAGNIQNESGAFEWGQMICNFQSYEEATAVGKKKIEDLEFLTQ
jgi:hypothetical protein